MNKEMITLLCLMFLAGMAVQFAFDMAFVINPVYHEAWDNGYNESENNHSKPLLSSNCTYTILEESVRTKR